MTQYYTDLRPVFPDPETWTFASVLRHWAAERPDAVCLECPEEDFRVTYANKGLDVMNKDELEKEFAKAVSGHAVIGTPDDVVAALTDLVTTLPVDPLLIRPQWPTMDADETIATIERLGREIVPAMKAITPRSDIAEEALVGGPA